LIKVNAQILWNFKTNKFARNKMCNCKICMIILLVSLN
jgi:hypothetical protein